MADLPRYGGPDPAATAHRCPPTHPQQRGRSGSRPTPEQPRPATSGPLPAGPLRAHSRPGRSGPSADPPPRAAAPDPPPRAYSRPATRGPTADPPLRAAAPDPPPRAAAAPGPPPRAAAPALTQTAASFRADPAEQHAANAASAIAFRARSVRHLQPQIRNVARQRPCGFAGPIHLFTPNSRSQLGPANQHSRCRRRWRWHFGCGCGSHPSNKAARHTDPHCSDQHARPRPQITNPKYRPPTADRVDLRVPFARELIKIAGSR